MLIAVCLLSAAVVDAGAQTSGLDTRPSNTSCVAPPRATGGATLGTQDAYPTAPKFTQPTKALQAPRDATRWFVLEKTGRVKAFTTGNPASVTTWLDFSSKVDDAGEGGLLGMAFHPNYPSTRQVFLSYTAPGSPLKSIVSRVILDNVTTPSAVTEQILLTLNQPYENHNGGEIAFGPDGLLYVGFGDGGSAGDPNRYAQNTTRLLGKMLRIHVAGVAFPSPGYSIPADNPFSANPKCGAGANGADCPEIYAWGLRNPWRWSFDTPSGNLWLADVGQGEREEVDLIELGGNYGWRCREGTGGYNDTGCPDGGFIDPVSEYPHQNGDNSITGGAVYRGSAISPLVGRYVFGDFGSGRVWALKSGQAGYTNELLVDTPLSISSFAPGPAGELYVTDYQGGRLHKLVPAGTPVTDTVPNSLASTGCVKSTAPREPSAGVIPFTVNAPFWSDDATKGRYLGLPNGTKMTLDAGSGHLGMPPGTVLVKSMYLAGKPIETRLLMRHPDGIWAGYTYEWNDAATGATRVRGGKRRLVNGQEWIYPSEGECLQCHTSVAGVSLGPTIAQLNGNLLYPSTGRTANQLTTLAYIGTLSAPLPGPVTSLPALTAPGNSSATLDQRARSYLQTNCAGCHQPGGPTPSGLDLRFVTPLRNTASCNVNPQSGDLGIVDARLIAPGAPARSVLLERMSRRDAHAMPPIASAIADVQGVTMMSNWIASLTGCNDEDRDNVDDSTDNCLAVANTNQRDSNNDGYGNLCDADITNDDVVNFADLNRMRARFGMSGGDEDLNGDGPVNFADLNIMKAGFGKPPGPSALHP